MIWRSLKRRANLLWLFGNFWWSYHAHWHNAPNSQWYICQYIWSGEVRKSWLILWLAPPLTTTITNCCFWWIIRQSVQKLCFHVKCKDKVISFMLWFVNIYTSDYGLINLVLGFTKASQYIYFFKMN